MWLDDIKTAEQGSTNPTGNEIPECLEDDKDVLEAKRCLDEEKNNLIKIGERLKERFNLREEFENSNDRILYLFSNWDEFKYAEYAEDTYEMFRQMALYSEHFLGIGKKVSLLVTFEDISKKDWINDSQRKAIKDYFESIQSVFNASIDGLISQKKQQLATVGEHEWILQKVINEKMNQQWATTSQELTALQEKLKKQEEEAREWTIKRLLEDTGIFWSIVTTEITSWALSRMNDWELSDTKEPIEIKEKIIANHLKYLINLNTKRMYFMLHPDDNSSDSNTRSPTSERTEKWWREVYNSASVAEVLRLMPDAFILSPHQRNKKNAYISEQPNNSTTSTLKETDEFLNNLVGFSEAIENEDIMSDEYADLEHLYYIASYLNDNCHKQAAAFNLLKL